jgi:hypothetical protein
MELLILAFWLCILGFAAYIILQAVAQVPMPSPFPQLVRGLVIIFAIILAFKMLLPHVPF